MFSETKITEFSEKSVMQNRTTPDITLLRVSEMFISRALIEASSALQLIQRDGKLPPELFDFAYRAELGCRGTMAKINSLIELYSGDDTMDRVRYASYRLEQFFDAISLQMNRLLGHKLDGTISFHLEESSYDTATFDARRVSMILYQLVANSLQHGRTNNKNVKISAFVGDSMLRISVKDYGGGILPSKTKDLFCGFSKALDLHRLATGPFPPVIQGIGLPLCKKLVEDMGGNISLKNYKVGAKFILEIPQRSNCLREISMYQPNDTLLKGCFAELLIRLGSKSENNKEEEKL